MQLRDVLDQFILQLRANGRSDHTVTQYQRYVRMLETWLITERRSTVLRDISPSTLAEFLVSPTVRGRRGGGARKASSTNAIRSALRVLFAFARDAGYVERNAAALIKRARCGTAPPKTLSEDEQAALPRLRKAGAEVQIANELPMKLALFDNNSGMISLDDPVVSHPGLTALVFEHSSLFSAMRSLFNDFWKRARPL